MKTLAELQETPRLLISKTAWDGGNGMVDLGKLRGTVIWSHGAGWEHVSVNPYKRSYMPTWEDMCRIKDMFFREDEVAVQFHPAKDQYVNNMEHCLHLWRCTYTEQPTPPSIMVGIRDGQSRSDAIKEAEALGRVVDAQGEKLRLIDEYLAENNIHPKWREMILEYRQMIADGKHGEEAARK